MSWSLWIAIGLIGGAGSVARLQGTIVLARGVRPRGTLLVNLLGTLLLGVLAGSGVTGEAQLLAGTALLGSFTTFSTWMHECAGLWGDGHRAAAARLLGGALAGGLLAAALGRWLGGTL